MKYAPVIKDGLAVMVEDDQGEWVYAEELYETSRLLSFHAQAHERSVEMNKILSRDIDLAIEKLNKGYYYVSSGKISALQRAVEDYMDKFEGKI